MNCHFFAAEADKLQLLDFLFTKTDMQVFDSYSDYGKNIKQYHCTMDIAAAFDLQTGSQFAVSLSLWSPKFSGIVHFEKIALNPKYCDGHTFRYRTDGWGLLHLHFGGEQNDILYYSNLNHLNQSGATANEEDSLNPVKASDWNWVEINRVGRQLKYLIHQKLAVDKLGSIDILPSAAERQRQDVILR